VAEILQADPGAVVLGAAILAAAAAVAAVAGASAQQSCRFSDIICDLCVDIAL